MAAPGAKSKLAAVLVKLETQEGVDANPTASDVVPLVSDPQFTIGAEFENPNDDVHFGGLGRWASLPPGGEYGEISFDVALRGCADGATLAASKPEADALLQATGAAVAVVSTVGLESVTYKWGLNAGEKSATIYYHEGGLLHKLVGCRGTVTFLLETGRPVRATFRMRGIHDEVDAAFPALALDAAVLPPPVQNTTYTLDGWAAIWTRCQFDVGTEVSLRPDPAGADGLLPYFIGDYNPTMGLDPELVAKATYDVRGKWKSQAGLAVVAGPIGSAAGNRLTFTAPKAQLQAPGRGVRNLLRNFDLTCRLNVNTGQDFLSLEFS